MRHNGELILDPSVIYANGDYATRAEAAAAQYKAAGSDETFRAGIEREMSAAQPVAAIIGVLSESILADIDYLSGWPKDKYPQNPQQISAAVGPNAVGLTSFRIELDRAQSTYDARYSEETAAQKLEFGFIKYPLIADLIANNAQCDAAHSQAERRQNDVYSSLNAAFATGGLETGVRAGVARVLQSSQTPAEAIGRIADFCADLRVGIDNLSQVIQGNPQEYDYGEPDIVRAADSKSTVNFGDLRDHPINAPSRNGRNLVLPAGKNVAVELASQAIQAILFDRHDARSARVLENLARLHAGISAVQPNVGGLAAAAINLSVRANAGLAEKAAQIARRLEDTGAKALLATIKAGGFTSKYSSFQEQETGTPVGEGSKARTVTTRSKSAVSDEKNFPPGIHAVLRGGKVKVTGAPVDVRQGPKAAVVPLVNEVRGRHAEEPATYSVHSGPSGDIDVYATGGGHAIFVDGGVEVHVGAPTFEIYGPTLELNSE